MTRQLLNNNDLQLVQAMQLLGDETRYKIFKILLDDQSPCVSEISDMLNLSVSAVSQQFKLFELSGMVKRNRHGKKICYSLSLNNSATESLINVMQNKT